LDWKLNRLVKDLAQAEAEAELLERTARGDSSAFGQLYDRLSGVLFSVAAKILIDQRDAEDVVQETFLQIWSQAHTFDQRLGKPLAWAVMIARNKAIDRIRSTQRRSRLIEQIMQENSSELTGTPAPDVSAGSGESSEKVRGCVKGLPAEQRQTIEMAFFAGLTHAEVATTLGQPLGTIKARIRRGMLRLRDCLEGAL
jgi:RNA polymerase sigma-70 factor (ECF subfamily)